MNMIWQDATRTFVAPLVVSVLLAVVTSMPAAAQGPKAPGLGYVFPPVMQAGQTTAVMMGGFDFTPDMQWFVHNDRIQLQIDGPPGDYHLPPPPYWTGPRAGTNAPPIPREIPARLSIPGDIGEGIIRWQVANANGASDTAVFFVSRTPQVVESRSRDMAQNLPALPVGISGRLSRLTEVDRYHFVAHQTGFVHVDLMARRLGADFNGAIKVHDTSGRLLADFSDTQGLDGGVTFPVVAGVEYNVSIHDTDFRGDRAYIYHLSLKYGAPILATIPAYAQRGSASSIQVLGIGLQTGQNQLESLETSVKIPPEESQRVHQLIIAANPGTADFSIPLSSHPEIVSHPRAEAEQIVPPIGVTGIFNEIVREGRFEWVSGKGDFWAIRVQSRELNSRMDVSLEVFGPNGTSVVNSNNNGGTTDPAIEFQAETEGLYTVVVRGVPVNQNHAAYGDSLDQFRLSIQKSTPDFDLVIPQKLSIGLGDKAELPVQVIRHGGFAESIRLNVEDLPDGVTLSNEAVIPPGANDVKLMLQCAADAATTARVIHISGMSTWNGEERSKSALAAASSHLCPVTPEAAGVHGTLLAITLKAPFAVQVVDRERQHDVHRGTTFPAELEIVRDSLFNGDMRIEMSAQQDRVRMGVRGGILEVPASVSKVFYPVFMPEWLSTDLTRRIVVHGVAVIPDPKGNLRHVAKAADARITMIMEGALLKLSAKTPETVFRAGDAIEVSVQISRSPKLPLSATVHLNVPEELKGLIECSPITMEPSTDISTLTIRTVNDQRLSGSWDWTLQATSMQDGQWPVVSETSIVVRFQ